MIFFSNIKSKKGQSLVEAMVALGALTVGFAGITTLLSQSIAYNRIVSDEYRGTYLAEEGIELVKNLIDHNQILRDTTNPGLAWNSGLSDGTYEVEWDSESLAANQNRNLYFDGELYSYSTPPGSLKTSFKRTVTLTNSVDQIVVLSTVIWDKRGGGTSSVTLEDHFLHWRQ